MMYGNYSYGKRHLGRVIPTHNRVITVGNLPPHPTAFVGPVTARELKKRLEVDQKKLEKKIQQRKCLADRNQNETETISEKLLPTISEGKENNPRSGNTISLVSENDSFNSKNSSNCSNQTYTLNSSDRKSPSHLMNSTYDKLEETENFNLQIDITQNTFVRERKSTINKSTFRNYRQNRQDSMASDVHFNGNKTTEVSQLTDTSTNVNCTNRSVLLSFDNLKLDDECGDVTSMSMKAYKDSPVAKILMDEKFSGDYRSPSKNKNTVTASKFTPSKVQIHQRKSSTPQINTVRKSIAKNVEEKKPATPKSISKDKEDRINSTPKSASVRKSFSKNREESFPATPNSTPVRKSISKNDRRRISATNTPTSARKSLFKTEDTSSLASKSTSANKSRKSVVKEEIHSLKNSSTTLRDGSSVKRKFSHLSQEELSNTSQNNSPAIRKSIILNKENISVRKTPGKMSATLITELKAENCLINTSFRDSTGSSNNRSTPDVFRKMPNEMWKSKLEDVPEKKSATPFKSKLPQLKKTPKKYDYIQSPLRKYIHQGEGVKSMSKLRHSACVHDLVVTSKSETKKELSESKNKPCKIPQRYTSVQRKLDLPKMKKNDTSNSSIVFRTSSLLN